ncbi:MAG: adenylyltransferase/cytidyltransferase family protein [Betaproteobacteria bacterium]|nr:adenylyltransferase/cytidyltransferase family protein [Betaproteobacteria bacterium]
MTQDQSVLPSHLSIRLGIMGFSQAANQIRIAQADGMVVGLCHGCFDILHFGHLRHLESAARSCDLLIVSITADRYVNKGPKRPIFAEKYRAELLSGLACVNGVVISDFPTALEVLRDLRPSIFFKGQEYHIDGPVANPNFQIEREFASSIGTEVMHTHEETFSSTETLSRLYETLREQL